MARKDGEPLDGRNLMLYINTAETNETPAWRAAIRSRIIQKRKKG